MCIVGETWQAVSYPCLHPFNELCCYQSKSGDSLTTVNMEYLVKQYSSYVIDFFMRLLAKDLSIMSC